MNSVDHQITPKGKLSWSVAILSAVAFLSALAFALAVKSLSEQSDQRAKEAHTLKISCERSRVFGPSFIAFLERTEDKEHTGALEGSVTFEGKPVAVLAFYRATIPKSCP